MAHDSGGPGGRSTSASITIFLLHKRKMHKRQETSSNKKLNRLCAHAFQQNDAI